MANDTDNKHKARNATGAVLGGGAVLATVKDVGDKTREAQVAAEHSLKVAQHLAQPFDAVTTADDHLTAADIAKAKMDAAAASGSHFVDYNKDVLPTHVTADHALILDQQATANAYKEMEANLIGQIHHTTDQTTLTELNAELARVQNPNDPNNVKANTDLLDRYIHNRHGALDVAKSNADGTVTAGLHDLGTGVHDAAVNAGTDFHNLLGGAGEALHNATNPAELFGAAVVAAGGGIAASSPKVREKAGKLAGDIKGHMEEAIRNTKEAVANIGHAKGGK